MNKTLKKQLNNLTLEELFIIAQELDHTFWAYKDLKDYAVDKIKNDFLNIGTYIFNTLNTTLAAYYYYDAIMGGLDSITPITKKEEFINFLQNYNDEDIKKVLKTIKEI